METPGYEMMENPGREENDPQVSGYEEVASSATPASGYEVVQNPAYATTVSEQERKSPNTSVSKL